MSGTVVSLWVIFWIVDVALWAAGCELKPASAKTWRGLNWIPGSGIYLYAVWAART